MRGVLALFVVEDIPNRYSFERTTTQQAISLPKAPGRVKQFRIKKTYRARVCCSAFLWGSEKIYLKKLGDSPRVFLIQAPIDWGQSIYQQCRAIVPNGSTRRASVGVFRLFGFSPEGDTSLPVCVSHRTLATTQPFFILQMRQHPFQMLRISLTTLFSQQKLSL